MLVPAVHGRHSVVGISIWLVVLVTYSKVQYVGFFQLHVSLFLKNLRPPISSGILDRTFDNFVENTVEKV